MKKAWLHPKKVVVTEQKLLLSGPDPRRRDMKRRLTPRQLTEGLLGGKGRIYYQAPCQPASDAPGHSAVGRKFFRRREEKGKQQWACVAEPPK